MKNLLRCLVFALMIGNSYADSNLPPCQGNDANGWSNCFGTQEDSIGNKYVGEFKDGYRSGQGTYFYVNGNKYVGQWLFGTRFGLGTLFAKNGVILNKGLWDIEFQDTSTANRTNPRETNESKILQTTIDTEKPTSRLPPQQQMLTSPNFINPETGRRVALVVGNANYLKRPLRNPRNDADDVSNALKATGFQVIDLRDASLQQMRAGVRLFGDRLINNDVGLVYYSGHGVEVKGRNYFIPVNADIMREDEIADQGLDVSLILEKMNTAGKGVNILIVDACRDDPFGRSFRSSSRGLAQMDAPRGTIIAYATSPGKVASDGDPRERNSPYTKNLVKAMQQPNKPIEQVFKEVRRAVQEETKNQQTPWENTSLSGDFYFKVQR